MSNTIFMMMAANVTVAEQPIYGQTGVWLKSGAVTVSSAMRMTGMTITSGQSQYVYSRGVAQSCIIASGGTQYISSGGTAAGCVVARFQYVMSGGTALDTVLSGNHAPRQFMSRGAWASGTIVNTLNAAMQVGAGASAADITLSNGELWLTGSAGDITVSRGKATVYPGGIGSAITVASAATLTVSSGGMALAVTSNAGAIILVSSGGYIEYVE